MGQFQVHILAADNVLYEGPCESIVIPTLQGQYGILAGHCNTIAAVVPGMLTYRVPGQTEEIAAVSAGLIKIENDDVLVLASPSPALPGTPRWGHPSPPALGPRRCSGSN